MKPLASISALLLICVFANRAWSQCEDKTAVTIEMTSVDKGLVLGAGKITIGKDDLYLGTKVYLQNKADPKIQIPGFLKQDPPPTPGKITPWDSSWPGVAKGDYTMIIEVRVGRGDTVVTESDKKDVTVP